MSMRSVSITLLLISVAITSGWRSGRAAPVCSIIPVVTNRDTSATFFVGRARPGTVLAGPGTMRYGIEEGHWGTPRSAQPINGQIVLVDTLGGAGAARLEAAFARAGGREVVVVPWDYDPACQPVPWTRSGDWVRSLEPGFYRVRLRPESLWVGGRPVFDATYADIQPYPHGTFFQHGFRGTDALRKGPSLTPAEYFGLYAALPEAGQMTRDPVAAAAQLDAWERANPEIARKYPAPEVLRFVRSLMNRR